MITLDFMNASILTEGSYAKIDVITSCYEGLAEGVNDNFLVNTASTYTHSLIFEILENVKNALLALCQRVLSSLNNFILNQANLADKYRNLIIDRYLSIKEPFVIKTYEYPGLKNKFYPDITYSANTLSSKIESLQTAIIENGMSEGEAAYEVDKLIMSFGKDVIGGTVDPDNVKRSARSIALDHIRGRDVVCKLEQRDLNGFIDEIRTYKTVKDNIIKTRTAIQKEYESLKKLYTKTMEEKTAAAMSIKSMKQPEVERFKAFEYQRFANISLQMTRMFNAFITIYNEAFNTKLEVLHDKIDANRNTIVELMSRTGVLAAINAKTPSQKKHPLVFDPQLKT